MIALAGSVLVDNPPERDLGVEPGVTGSKESWVAMAGTMASRGGAPRSLLGSGTEDPNLLLPNGIRILTIHKLLAQEAGVDGEEPAHSPRSNIVDDLGDSRGLTSQDEGACFERRKAQGIDGGERSEENNIEGYSFSQSCTNTKRDLDTKSEDLMNACGGR